MLCLERPDKGPGIVKYRDGLHLVHSRAINAISFREFDSLTLQASDVLSSIGSLIPRSHPGNLIRAVQALPEVVWFGLGANV